MPREKMIPKPPPSPNDSGKSVLERTADLTRRLLSVPKADLPMPRKPKKKRR